MISKDNLCSSDSTSSTIHSFFKTGGLIDSATSKSLARKYCNKYIR